MLQEIIPFTEQDRKNNLAICKSLHSMSFEDAKKTLVYKSRSFYDVSFKDFCETKGADYEHLTNVALNGVLAKVFLPCTRGSSSDYRGIKPGQRAEVLINELKEQYAESIEKGDIRNLSSKHFCDYELKQDLAYIRIRIRISVKNEIRLAKKENRKPVIHPDYLDSSFFVN